MSHVVSALPKKFIILFLSLIFSACSIALVPAYDPSLVEGLERTNEKTLTLFSALANGSSAVEFAQHAKTYDEVIGSFEALKIQADSRLVPVLSANTMKRLNQKPGWLADLCGNTPTEASACVNPTPKVITKIVDTITRMRDAHRFKNTKGKSDGLKADGVWGFKNDYLLSIEQALTVETALKRD